jgi:hypothetical protein
MSGAGSDACLMGSLSSNYYEQYASVILYSQITAASISFIYDWISNLEAVTKVRITGPYI